MLLLESLVHSPLLFLTSFARLLVLELFVELISDQSTTLLLTKHGLFLLFIVQKGVELLNSGPFILLSQLRVDFSTAIDLA